MSDTALDMLRREAKASGLKITPQRTAIFRELLKAEDHPTAESIHRRILRKFPNISFDTVNRTLLTFSRIGLIKVVEGYWKAKRYDPDTGAHHHFRCVRCARIIDFHNKDYDNLAIPAEIGERFAVTSKTVALEGLCGKCVKP